MKVAFFVYSPFQVVCTYEAICYYNIKEFSIYCLGGKILEKNCKTPSLLGELDLQYKIIELGGFPTNIVSAYKFSKKEGVFDQVFIGDYFDPTLRLLASLFLKKNGVLIYMDDGASTLTATKLKHPLIKTTTVRVKIKYIVPAIVSSFKRHHAHFFSIFDVVGGDKNELKSIKARYENNNLSSIQTCIIGTTYKGFKSSHTFFPLLEETLKRYSVQGEQPIYTPHRAAVDDDIIKSICQRFNVQYAIGEYCVEVDYIKRGYRPSLIVGFGSTALFTLKKIYPDAHIISVKYPSAMTEGSEHIYDIVNDNLKKEGIEVVSIL